MENAKSSIAARPEPPQYEALRQDAIQFVKTMASKSKIDELTSRVRNLFSKLGQLDVESEITENEINAVLIPCSSWLESCANFVHKQLKRFWYWDISLAYIHPAIQVPFQKNNTVVNLLVWNNKADNIVLNFYKKTCLFCFIGYFRI